MRRSPVADHRTGEAMTSCPHCTNGCGCGWTDGYLGLFDPKRNYRGTMFDTRWYEGKAARLATQRPNAARTTETFDVLPEALDELRRMRDVALAASKAWWLIDECLAGSKVEALKVALDAWLPETGPSSAKGQRTEPAQSDQIESIRRPLITENNALRKRAEKAESHVDELEREIADLKQRIDIVRYFNDRAIVNAVSVGEPFKFRMSEGERKEFEAMANDLTGEDRVERKSEVTCLHLDHKCTSWKACAERVAKHSAARVTDAMEQFAAASVMGVELVALRKVAEAAREWRKTRGSVDVPWTHDIDGYRLARLVDALESGLPKEEP